MHTTHTAPVRELGAIEGVGDAFTVGSEVGNDSLMIVGPAEKVCFTIMTGRSEGDFDGGDGLGLRVGPVCCDVG